MAGAGLVHASKSSRFLTATTLPGVNDIQVAVSCIRRAWGLPMFDRSSTTCTRLTPLAWGLPVQAHRWPLSARLTPTRVGTSAPAPSRPRSTPAHPHLRGNFLPSLVVQVERAGSPPPAWELRVRCHPSARPLRLTPTCVGTSAHRTSRGVRHPAHPHLRGDFLCEIRANMPWDGSPPPAWGLRPLYHARHRRERLTPTCVGTSRSRCADRRPAAAHPHLRGDFDQHIWHVSVRVGSPPPAWGLPVYRTYGDTQVRLTPTCVGTSSEHLPASTRAPAHPHLRGDFLG